MAAQVPNIFVEQYDQGQKKIRADLMDENFAYVCDQIDTQAGAAQTAADNAQTAADSKTTPAEAANAAMPATSGVYIDYSFPSGATSVTIGPFPADGVLVFRATRGTDTSGTVGILCGFNSSTVYINSGSANFVMNTWLPVGAGRTATVSRASATQTVSTLRFMYLNGNVPS